MKPTRYKHFCRGNKLSNSLLTRIRIGRSMLNQHGFSIGLADSPECICHYREESPSHYFLDCFLYLQERQTLFDLFDERILVSPTKPYFSSVTSSPSPRPTPSRVYRRIWKRKRSPGELQRRQQRLFAYQNTSSPCITEPEQLESGSWEGGSRYCGNSELGEGATPAGPNRVRGDMWRKTVTFIIQPYCLHHLLRTGGNPVGHGHLHHLLAPQLRPVSQHHQFTVMGVAVGAISLL